MHRNKIRNICYLQLSVILLAIANAFAKKASNYPFMSLEFKYYYILQLLLFVVYAVVWQQLIKHFSLSMAYLNKSFGIIWTAIIAVLIFNETITITNILGAIIIGSGIFLVVTYDQ